MGGLVVFDLVAAATSAKTYASLTVSATDAPSVQAYLEDSIAHTPPLENVEAAPRKIAARPIRDPWSALLGGHQSLRPGRRACRRNSRMWDPVYQCGVLD